MTQTGISVKEIIQRHGLWSLKRKEHQIPADVIAADVGISKKQYLFWEKGLLMELLKKDLEKFHKVEEALNKRIADKRKG